MPAGPFRSTQGARYDAIDLYNSRPAITNDVIALHAAASRERTAPQAAIAADFDSFREDDTARGPLVRSTTLQNNSLNGIWIRPELTGIAEATDAMTYPNNPLDPGRQHQLHPRRPASLHPDLAPVDRHRAAHRHQRLDESSRPGSTSSPGVMIKSRRAPRSASTSTWPA